MWTDQRRFIIWALPLSATLIVALTTWSAVFPFHIYFGDEGIGVSKEKKFIVASIFALIASGGAYVCIGLYQMFFIELRKKFITSKIVPLGERYFLYGYYFRKAKFNRRDVLSVEAYPVKPRFGKNIVTALSWQPQTELPNYKVTLHDGREFYIPGDTTDLLELIEELRPRATE